MFSIIEKWPERILKLLVSVWLYTYEDCAAILASRRSVVALLFDQLFEPNCQDIIIISDSGSHLMFNDFAFEKEHSAHPWNNIDISIFQNQAHCTHCLRVLLPRFVDAILVQKDHHSELSDFHTVVKIIIIKPKGVFMAFVPLRFPLDAIEARQLDLLGIDEECLVTAFLRLNSMIKSLACIIKHFA